MGTVIENDTWKARLVTTSTGLRVMSPADSFIRRMAEITKPSERLFLACRALRKDEDCIEANLIVAAANEDQTIRLCYLNIAVEEGDRLWTSAIHTYEDVDLWEVSATHPLLHVITALGDEFFEAGWHDDARDAYERVVAMDPGDHLAVTDKLERIGPRLIHAM